MLYPNKIKIVIIYNHDLKKKKFHQFFNKQNKFEFSVPRPQVERVNLWQVLKKLSNDIDLNQEVRDSIIQQKCSQSYVWLFFAYRYALYQRRIGFKQRLARKIFQSANRKSANSWAHSAIANMQISEVCQSESRKSANLQSLIRKSANLLGVPIRNSKIRKFAREKAVFLIQILIGLLLNIFFTYLST